MMRKSNKVLEQSRLLSRKLRTHLPRRRPREISCRCGPSSPQAGHGRKSCGSCRACCYARCFLHFPFSCSPMCTLIFWVHIAFPEDSSRSLYRTGSVVPPGCLHAGVSHDGSHFPFGYPSSNQPIRTVPAQVVG